MSKQPTYADFRDWVDQRGLYLGDRDCAIVRAWIEGRPLFGMTPDRAASKTRLQAYVGEFLLDFLGTLPVLVGSREGSRNP